MISGQNQISYSFHLHERLLLIVSNNQWQSGFKMKHFLQLCHVYTHPSEDLMSIFFFSKKKKKRCGGQDGGIFHILHFQRKYPTRLAMITKFIINCVFHDVSDNMLMWFFTSSCSEQMAPFTLLSTSSVIISWCQKPPAAPLGLQSNFMLVKHSRTCYQLDGILIKGDMPTYWHHVQGEISAPSNP